MNLIFLLWVISAVLITCFPYFYGRSFSDEHYNWLIPPFPEDGLAYMAWVKQASLGEVLFKVKFTAIEHGRFLFHPLFLVCGWLSAITGWESGFSLFIGRIFSLFIFFYSFAYFLNALKIQGRSFWLSLLFVTYASGLGWIAPQEKTADLVSPGLITLWGNTWMIIYPVSRAMILLAFVWFYQAIESVDSSHAMRKSVLAGLIIGLLAFVHPYDVVFSSVILALYTLCNSRKWKLFLFFCLAALPLVAIQFGISILHPVAAAHSSAKMMSPPFYSYLAAMGVPGLLVLVFCGSFWFMKREKKHQFLLLWIAASLGLAYAPFWFQAKMVGGVHIPVCILAAVALDKFLFRWFQKKLWVQLIIVMLLFILTLPNHFVVFKAIQEEFHREKISYFISGSLHQAFQYLEKHSSPDDVVLADLKISGHIPGMSGNTVLYGHWAQSIDAGERMRWLGRFLFQGNKENKEVRIKELKDIGIRYILIDPAMKYSFGESNVGDLLELGDLVYTSNNLQLIEIY